MSSRDALLRLLDDQRQQYNYASSSPWYRSTRSAIESLKLAEESTNPKDQFSNLWIAVNHLYNPVQRSGEEENKALSRWGSAIVEAPRVEASLKGIQRDALEAIQKAEGKLLYDVQQKRDREGKVLLAAWLKKYPLPSSLKAIQYLLGISRDCRNATFHANYNPSNRSAVRGMEALVEVLEPFTRAAIEATIRNPIPGTTGRVPTYRGFLWPYFSNSNGFFSDYYLEELLPEEELSAFPVDETTDLLKQLGKDLKAMSDGLRDADAEETAQQWLEPVLFPVLDLAPVPGPKIVDAEGVYEPAYAMPSPDQTGSLSAEYQGKAAGEAITALVFVLPWEASLDGTWPGMEKAALQHVQEALRASDVAWAILTNGQQLRLLRKETVMQARSFAEVDLATILARMGTPDRDDAILAFRYGRALFSGPSFTETDAKELTLLDRVLAESQRHGAELGEELKRNVFTALEHLGEGFRYYLETHPDDREALRKEIAPDVAAGDFLTSEVLLEKIYESSLALMYRLLFLFYAESRDLLPMDQDLYREGYSLETLRDEVAERRDSPDETQRFVKGGHELYERLKQLFQLVNGSAPSLVPAFNGGLFSPQNYWLLDRCLVGDLYLAEAVDLLSRTRLPWRTGLVKVTYRDLSVRHLGEIYEGILEYHAHIATEDYVVLERTKSGRKEEYYEEVAELSAKQKTQLEEWREARESGTPPKRSNKVRGEKPKGSYFLVSGGRESKRKSSGSYYTPDYIVQYMIENTLGPLVRGENREGALKDVPLTSDEILELKVLDPAMGSGHFLVAALEYLARAHWEALNREGKDEDGVMSDEEYTACKRRVAERCIYGVDLNPLAVELAKLSIWLTTMDPQRPLSFLNHHLKCGNALLGAWVKGLGALPGSKTKPGQYNLFEHHFRARVPLMVRDVFRIMERETLSTDDIQAKKALDQAVAATKAPFVNIADAWMATYFDEKAGDYDVLLTDPNKARLRTSEAAQQHRFFHWELEFPEVWFNENGQRLEEGGFNAVVGNPPYKLLQPQNADSHSLQYYNSLDVTQYKIDIYHLFIHEGLLILGARGIMGLITPSTFLMNTYSSRLRRYIYHNAPLETIHIFRDGVFESASVDNVVFTAAKYASGENIVTNFIAQDATGDIDTDNSTTLSWSSIESPEYRFQPQSRFSILVASHRTIADVATVNFGMQLRNRKKFPKDVIKVTPSENLSAPYRPTLGGSDILPFYRWESRTAAFYDDAARRGGCWDPSVQLAPKKVLIRQVGNTPHVGYTDQGETCLNAMFIMISMDPGVSEEMLLGYMRSDFIKEVWEAKYSDHKKTFPKIKGTYLLELPFVALGSEAWQEIESLSIKAIDHQRSVVKSIDAVYSDALSRYGDYIWDWRNAVSVFALEQDDAFRKLGKKLSNIDNKLKNLIYAALKIVSYSESAILDIEYKINSIISKHTA